MARKGEIFLRTNIQYGKAVYNSHGIPFEKWGSGGRRGKEGKECGASSG